MRKTLLTVAAATGLATLSAGVLNAQPDPGTIDLATVESGSYKADPGHSMVVWSVIHLGFNDYYGIFGDVAGTLELDKDNLANSKVDVTIPIASVTVPSAGLKDHFLRAGRDGAAPDFFGPDPAAARFVSTNVHQTGETTADVTGDLTLNGQTHPVTIKAELAGMGANPMSRRKTLGFHGKTTLDRTQFDVSYGTAFGIPAEVPLEITIAFEMQ